MGVSLIRNLGQALFVPPVHSDDRLNLRSWFIGFVAWLAALTVLAIVGLVAYESGNRLGMAAWLLALYMFYLSLCCTFFPLPTTWIVMLMASDFVAGEVGVQPYLIARLVIVASLGAWCTAMANLNEYHIFTFLLRYGWAAKVRQTRLYEVAAGWFGIRPFWTIVLFSFIPIPVDIIRWLAITYRYPRLPFFVAYYLGRWVRYAGLAGVTIWGQLRWHHILIVQCAVAAVALFKIIRQFIRQHRANHEQPDPTQAVPMVSKTEFDTMGSPTTARPALSDSAEHGG
jgi:membrane protein YqaA with SNARE-associated domain